MTVKTVKFGISIPYEVLDKLNKIIEELGYVSRSSAILDAINMFINEKMWNMKEDVEVVGIISYLYNHNIKGIEEKLTNVGHEFLDIVTLTSHLHLTHDKCLEIIIVRGLSKKVKDFIKRLQNIKGVEQTKFILTIL